MALISFGDQICNLQKNLFCLLRKLYFKTSKNNSKISNDMQLVLFFHYHYYCIVAFFAVEKGKLDINFNTCVLMI